MEVFVCNHRPLKTEIWRTRLTVGGDLLECPYDAASPAASLIKTKLIINSTISDAHKGARFMAADLKDFFLNTPMPHPEFMKIYRKYLTQEIIDAYDLEKKLIADGYIYIRIKRGMYGLKQAARLAYDLLCERLALHGYAPSLLSPNIWGHKTRPTKFCLCVDDFGIKYFNNTDIQHLLDALKQHYTVSCDWSGENYCGFQLEWFYAQGYVKASMPNYIKALLKKLKHTPPARPVHAPHKWSEPAYGQKYNMLTQPIPHHY